jgi:hypothetical protein
MGAIHRAAPPPRASILLRRGVEVGMPRVPVGTVGSKCAARGDRPLAWRLCLAAAAGGEQRAFGGTGTGDRRYCAASCQACCAAAADGCTPSPSVESAPKRQADKMQLDSQRRCRAPDPASAPVHQPEQRLPTRALPLKSRPPGHRWRAHTRAAAPAPPESPQASTEALIAAVGGLPSRRAANRRAAPAAHRCKHAAKIGGAAAGGAAPGGQQRAQVWHEWAGAAAGGAAQGCRRRLGRRRCRRGWAGTEGGDSSQALHLNNMHAACAEESNTVQGHGALAGAALDLLAGQQSAAVRSSSSSSSSTAGLPPACRPGGEAPNALLYSPGPQYQKTCVAKTCVATGKSCVAKHAAPTQQAVCGRWQTMCRCTGNVTGK